MLMELQERNTKRKTSEWPGDKWQMVDAALFYADLGWRILPVGRDKLSLVKEWQNVASNDADQIRAWWKLFPSANIGLHCGRASGIAAVDIDVKDGKLGMQSALALGLDDCASNLKASTPSGGLHLFYAHHELPFRTSVSKAADDIDLRSSDLAECDNGSGYVLLAPSIGLSGKRYAWTGSDLNDIQLPASECLIPGEIAYCFCFGAKERLVIEGTPALKQRLLDADRRDWRNIYNTARTFVEGGIKRASAGASPRSDLNLDHPYIAKVLENELDAISGARKNQNDNLSRRSASVGTLLAGMGFTAASQEAKTVKGEIHKAALAMKSLDPAKPWDSPSGRNAIEATIDGQFSWGLRNARDLSHVNIARADQIDDAPATIERKPVEASDGRPAKNTALAGRRVAQLMSMSDVKAKPIEWLWPKRIPRGALSIIAGDPSQGKSQVTCHMAAIISTGRSWCDESGHQKRDPKDVLMLNAEDAADTVIKPRLEAAGADVSKVFTIKSVIKYDNEGNGTDADMSLAQDIQALDEALIANGNIELVVIDPISAYLGKVDSHNNSEVRGVLAPLARLAEKHNVAVVCVSHLNKGTGGKVTDRVTGSLAFVAAARAVYAVGPDTAEGADDDTKVFCPVKTNLAPNVTGLSFKIETVDSWSADGPITSSKVVWGEATSTSADDMFKGKSDGGDGRKAGKERLEVWLSTFLTSGHWYTFDVIEAAAKRDGIDRSKRTFERAANALGVEMRRGGVGEAGSEWRRPKPS